MDQGIDKRTRVILIARVLSIPIFALLLAVALLNTPLLSKDSLPEIIGGEQLRRVLRIIAIVFGLSCLPGGLIGIAFGSLIARNTQFSLVAIQVLRFAQWLPVMIWWVLVPLALLPPGQQLGRYFFIWTISLPAVALAACYYFLCARLVPQCAWGMLISKVAGLTVLRALFVSAFLAMTVWAVSWLSGIPPRTIVYFFVFLALVLFQLAVHWVYRSSLWRTIESPEGALEGPPYRQAESFIALIVWVVLLFFWEFLSWAGAVQVSVIEILKASAVLIADADTWSNIGVSLFEILSGLALTALVTFAVHATASLNNLLGQTLARAASLIFVAPVVLLPLWLFSLVANPYKFTVWTSSCVAVFCFSVFIKRFWAISHKSMLSRFLSATEAALPYAFCAVVYGEMMNAIAGLGFAMGIAGATSKTSSGLAVFLIMFFLFVALTLIIKSVVERLDASHQEKTKLLTPEHA